MERERVQKSDRLWAGVGVSELGPSSGHRLSRKFGGNQIYADTFWLYNLIRPHCFYNNNTSN